MTPLLIHAAVVFLLTGIIWTIQVALYPGFVDVERRQWPRYHRRYSHQILLFAGPLMVTELGTAGWLLWHAPDALHLFFFTCALGTWILAALVFIPIHQSIVTRPTDASLRRLTRFNWLRTLIWTSCALASFLSLMEP